MTRPADHVRVEIIEANGSSGGSFDNFTSLQITNDLSSPAQASFEVGEDGSYVAMRRSIQPGAQYKVFVNQKPRLSGRVENNDIPLDTGAGSVVRFSVKTKLADAQYSSADPAIKVRNSTIKQFILDLYKRLNFTEADFHFSAAAARNLMTGKSSPSGAGDTVNLARLKIKEARIRPPETIFAAADRHLRRHGLQHWDGPDGKIIVGAPSDTQDPIYRFNAYIDGGNSQLNNIQTITKIRDVSGMPTSIAVFGRGTNRTHTRVRVHGLAQNEEMGTFGFYRPLILPSDSIRTNALAEHAAARELSARSRGFDTYSLETDGLSFWDGDNLINYAPDTVALINSDTIGGNDGAYMIHRTTLYRDAGGGDRSNLVLIARGLWKL